MGALRKWPETPVAWLCILCSFGLYCFSLASVVQGFDSAELTMGAYDLGFVHPTGYPLYLLLGRLFIWLPFGNIGLRANLMSAVFASLAVGILFKLIYQQTLNLWAAITSTALMATAPLFWSQAIRAEVYTLQMFLMVSVLYNWRIAALTGSQKHYYLAFLFLGLGLSNHLTSMLLWFAVLASAFWFEPKMRRSTLPASILGVAMAGFFYLYFPWRSKVDLQIDYIRPYFQVDPGSLGGVWWLLSGKPFHCLLTTSVGIPTILSEFLRLVMLVWEQTLGFGFILGVWGWRALQQSQNNWNRLLTSYFLVNLLMFLVYGAIDKEVMFLPIYLVLSIWTAHGIQSMVDWLSLRLAAVERNRLNTIINVFLLMVILAGVYLDWNSVSLKNDRRAFEFARQVLNQVPPSTTIVSHWATASVFDYLIFVEKVRPDVTSYNVDFYFLGIQRTCQPITDQQLLDNGWIEWLVERSAKNQLCFIEPLHRAPEGYHWENQGYCWGLFTEESKELP